MSEQKGKPFWLLDSTRGSSLGMFRRAEGETSEELLLTARSMCLVPPWAIVRVVQFEGKNPWGKCS